MSSLIHFNGSCAHCDRATSQAWQIKHPETAMHWRCAKCLRTLLGEGKPIIVTGYSTRYTRVFSDQPLRVYRALAAAVEAWNAAPRPAP